MSTLVQPVEPGERIDPETVDPVVAEHKIAEREVRTQRRLITGLFVGYLVVGGGLTYLRGGSFLTPEKFGILLLGGGLVLGQGKAFIRDWAPFLLLLFGYELMRGVADNVADVGNLSREDHGRVLVQPLIDAEKLLFFGEIPTLWLQDKLFVEGTTHWYDAVAAVTYMFHFVLPLAFGFLLWARDRRLFRRFMLTLLAMSYTAFVLFMLFPAAPPWLAAQWGYLDGLERPSYQAYKLFLPQRFADVDTFRLWTQASPNPVAALPSLHAAFPWLVLLVAVQTFGRWGYLALIYNVALWFSVVYLSQHWFVDVLAGMALATVAWWGMGWFLDRGAGGRMREKGGGPNGSGVRGPRADGFNPGRHSRNRRVEPSPRGRGQGEGVGAMLPGGESRR